MNKLFQFVILLDRISVGMMNHDCIVFIQFTRCFAKVNIFIVNLFGASNINVCSFRDVTVPVKTLLHTIKDNSRRVFGKGTLVIEQPQNEK